MFLTLFFFQAFCSSPQLFYEAFTSSSFTTSEGWLIQNTVGIFSDCNGQRILGGFNNFGTQASAMFLLELPPHHTLYITFQFWQIDSWDSELFNVYLDQILSHSKIYSFPGTQLCGSVSSDIVQDIEITQTHNSPSVFIFLTSSLDEIASNESWGIRSFKLYIFSCPTGCVTCEQGDDVTDCLPWVLQNSAFLSTQLISDEGWTITNGFQQTSVCGNVPLLGGFALVGQNSIITKAYQIRPHNLLKIKIRFAFIDSWDDEYIQLNVDGLSNFRWYHLVNLPGLMLICGISFEDTMFNTEITFEHHSEFLIFTFSNSLNELLNNESLGIRDVQIFYYDETCGNGVKEGKESCDDGNTNPFDGCFNCEFSCVAGCSHCIQGTCFECYPEFQFNQIDNSCSIMVVNKICQSECVNCQFGKCYQCNNEYLLKDFQCVSICGDGILANDEECEDQNQIKKDGCYQCKNDCEISCSDCVRGICRNCVEGWYLNENYSCQHYCGDNIVALASNEECDNSYDDDCFNCNIKCNDYCQSCFQGVCFACQPNFTLINEKCQPVCGDGLISAGLEECDDMNVIPYDGCFECQFQCNLNCTSCINGLCHDDCQFGYQIQDGVCQTVCGDGIIAGLEECEYNEDQDSKYCYQCFYKCPKNCEDCIEGICYQCLQGFELNQQKNYCQTICGDGKVMVLEQCDDQNTENVDGCLQQCEIEQNYLCKNLETTFSQCIYSKQPKIDAYFIEEKFLIQYVALRFTQNVKTSDEDIIFSDFIIFSILDLDPKVYSIELVVVEEASNIIKDVNYIIKISFQESINSLPYLHIDLLKTLYNIDDQQLESLQTNVKLNRPGYLDDNQQQNTIILKNAAQFIFYSMGGMGLVAALLGNSLVLSSVLEILQQQSYLRYINVIFPNNLFLYFESSNILTIQPLLDIIKFDKLSFLLFNDYYLESYEKLKFYQVNADIFSNLQGQIFQILFVTTSYCLSKMIVSQILNIQSMTFNKLGNYLTKLLLQVKRFCFAYLIEIEKNILNFFLEANIWDLLFSSFLQLSAFSWRKEIFMPVRSYLGITLAFIIIFGFLMNAIKVIPKNGYQNYTFFKFWSMKNLLFSPLKKIIFLAILVLFQDTQQIQTILLSFISLVYLIFIIKFKPANSSQDYQNLILREGSVFIFTLTSALYWDQFNGIFNYNQSIKFGWIHIALLTLVLFINILFQLKDLVLFVYNKIRNKYQQHSTKASKSDPYPLRNIVEL